MAKLIQVNSELVDGAMKKVVVDGREILLIRLGSTYYATNNRCPHMGGDLSQGKLVGTIVTCPRHGSQFDVTTGQVVRWTNWSGLTLALGKIFRPPKPLTTYKTRLEGDKVLIEI